MGRKSKKKALNSSNRKHWVDAATALWDLAANKKNPNAMRVLAEILGLDSIALLLILKVTGDRTINAEAVAVIAEAIEREDSKNT